MDVENSLVTTEIVLRSIYFNAHPYLCSDFLILKNKIYLVFFCLVGYHSENILDNYVITTKFQSNLSNRNFNFIYQKMSYICFYLALFQSQIGGYIIDIQEIYFTNNCGHTLILTVFLI